MENLLEEIVSLTKAKGWNPIVGDIHMKQQQWLSWFRGNVNGFHTFNQKINGKAKKMKRLTMNMPKKICEDYHSLIWNDRCEIKIENPEAQEVVNRVLEENNFDVDFGALLELSFGIGMGYMVEYLDDNVTKIDFVTFENALPLKFNNTKIEALLTMNYYKDNDTYITHLTYQYFEKDNYIVEHEIYESESGDTLGRLNKNRLKTMFGNKVLKERYTFKVLKPFFQVLRPNIKNHYDTNSPYGISIYATMLDYFIACDTLFDALQSDTITNKTRIILDGQMLQVKMEQDDQGNISYINYVDENDTTIMAVPFSDEATGQKAIEFFSGTYQHDKIQLGIDAVLRYIGFRGGLGKNFYSFMDGVVYQNESNVISTNSDTYKSKKKHELIVGRVIKDLVIAILELESLVGRYKGKIDPESIEIIFDDSIVIDDEAQEKKYYDLADRGLIPKWRVVAKVLKISDTEAQAIIAEAEKERDNENKKIASAYTEEE